MAAQTSMSEDMEMTDRTPDSNPGPSGESTVRKNADRWRRKGKETGQKDPAAAAAANSSAASRGQQQQQQPPQVVEALREERLRMVIHHLYGTQAHYQAAQKFLKNRTLRKMNDQGGMTLYDRIMAYRRLKGEDGEQSATTSPQQEGAVVEQRQTTTRTSTSSDSSKGKVSRESPKQNSPSSRSLQHLDRSDTSFASVDISDLTQLDEEKNRTPSPQPTFEDRPSKKQAQQSGHDYEAQATARDVHVQLHDTNQEVTTDRRVSSAVERSAVTTATVVAARRAHTSNADSHGTHQEYKEKQKAQHKEVHKEKYESKEKHKAKSENEVVQKSNTKEVHEEKSEHKETHKEKTKRRDSEEDVRKEKREEKFVEKATSAAVVTAVTVNESSSSSKREKAERKESRNEGEEEEEKEKEEKHTSKITHEEKSTKEEAVKVAVVAASVSQSVKETSERNEKVNAEVSKSESRKSHSERSSSRTSEKNILEQASDAVEASVAKSDTPEAPVIETAASPVATEAPVAAAAAAAAAAPAAAPKPKKAKSRAKSGRKKAKKEEEDNNTIAALDKLADKNLNSLLGNGDNGGEEDSEVDQQMLDKVFSPKFQAELDDFLRTT